jgi:hypothetical protein
MDKSYTVMEILNAIGSIAGIVAAILFVIFKNSAQKYVDEKAKNLATIEDTEKITNEVEKVKTDYLQRSHAWKHIFEYEYAVLKDVWSSTWDFQAHARSLRPLFDHLPEDEEKRKEVFTERYEKYIVTANKFRDAVIKNQPFMPVHVYESCMSLRETVIELQVDFEMSINDTTRPDWKKIHECSKTLDERIENLNVSIREHIYGKVRGAEPGV